MAYAQLVNKDGKTVSPNADTFAAAAANADWAHAPAYYLILTDQAGAKSWPITGASFILVYAVPQDLTATTEALKFFNWAYKSGSQMASELDYVPLPDAVIKQVRATWKSEIKGVPVLSDATPAGAAKQM
jgi:phosphate transport system substrate-binding protein